MELKIDSVGRIDIPKKIRALLHLRGGDRLRLTVNEKKKTMILEKAESRCLCCTSTEELVLLGEGLYLCRRCLKNKMEG